MTNEGTYVYTIIPYTIPKASFYHQLANLIQPKWLVNKIHTQCQDWRWRKVSWQFILQWIVKLPPVVITFFLILNYLCTYLFIAFVVSTYLFCMVSQSDPLVPTQHTLFPSGFVSKNVPSAKVRHMDVGISSTGEGIVSKIKNPNMNRYSPKHSHVGISSTGEGIVSKKIK